MHTYEICFQYKMARLVHFMVHGRRTQLLFFLIISCHEFIFERKVNLVTEFE